jgi:hypothetical protein
MSQPEYGETWVYEGIIGAVPGLELDTPTALGVQFVVFESVILGLAWFYDLPTAAVAGTVAVVVATAGSAALVRIGRQVRREAVPASYRRLLFGSNVEVVLAIFAYAALLTYLFVVDARAGGTSLVETLLGDQPPALAVYALLLVLWDVCYRIGAGWWASIAALWRSLRFQFDDETRRGLRRADLETAGFGVLQLTFVPFLRDHPVLLVAVVGHVIAVIAVTGLSLAVLRTRSEEPAATR